MQSVEDDYDIDSAWSSFLVDGTVENDVVDPSHTEVPVTIEDIPKGTYLYISTKTKIAYLSSPINLDDVFWKVDVMPYHLQQEGVVKKQMKFNFTDEDQLKLVSDKLVGLKNVDEQIITQIINPSGRIKFKDIRKISIGLSHKDITSYRSKKKSAFYNCFVLIMRVEDEDIFKEIHIKVFNTGKLEIPGIRTDRLLYKTLDLLTNLIRGSFARVRVRVKERSAVEESHSRCSSCRWIIRRWNVFKSSRRLHQ